MEFVKIIFLKTGFVCLGTKYIGEETKESVRKP